MRIGVVSFTVIMLFGCGYGSSYNSGSPMPGTMPSITELVPNETPAGSPAFMLTVNGSSFGTSAAVYWNGSPLATTYVTGNQVIAAVPAANVDTAGTVAVYVRSGNVNSNTLNFTVR